MSIKQVRIATLCQYHNVIHVYNKPHNNTLLPFGEIFGKVVVTLQ
jgi:hypothetical protein